MRAGWRLRSRWIAASLVASLLPATVEAQADAPAVGSLREFLEPLFEPAGRAGFAIERDAFEGLRAGLLCASYQDIHLCRDPENGAVVELGLVNAGSPRVNPEDGGIWRRYNLSFAGRSRQNLKLAIAEQARPSGRDSHITMRTSVYLFPRQVLPAVRVVEVHGREVVQVRLPTGEPVCFDAQSKEILAGVLREDQPIDSSPNRHSRRFARVSYHGAGLTIRVDQRGSTPEKAKVWGVRKMATIQHGGRRCQVAPKKLWEQKSGWYDFRFPADAALYELVRRVCGWEEVELPTELPTDPRSCEELGIEEPTIAGREAPPAGPSSTTPGTSSRGAQPRTRRLALPPSSARPMMRASS